MKFGFGSTPEKNGIPHIDRVLPTAAIPGGEVAIYGHGFSSKTQMRPTVQFGDVEAAVAMASDSRLIARVPEGATGGIVRVVNAGHESKKLKAILDILDGKAPVEHPDQ